MLHYLLIKLEETTYVDLTYQVSYTDFITKTSEESYEYYEDYMKPMSASSKCFSKEKYYVQYTVVVMYCLNIG